MTSQTISNASSGKKMASVACIAVAEFINTTTSTQSSEATNHHPDGIILLCTACHGKKTKGLLSRETIKKDLANPRCKQNGFSFEAFDVGTEHPKIVFGSVYGMLRRMDVRGSAASTPPSALGKTGIHSFLFRSVFAPVLML